MRTAAFCLSIVLIFMIPWEGAARIPGLGTTAKFTGFVVALLWAATIIFTGRLRKPGPFQIAVCLFVLWNAVSIFWSADADRTATQVVTWLQLLGLVLILWDLYRTRAALLAGLQAYILGAYISLAGAVFNYMSGNPFYTHYQRFSPGETNPDGFGFLLALGIPVAWYLAASEGSTRISRWLRLLNYAYIPAAFIGIALSGTRTAMIAAVPGMVYGLSTITQLRPAPRLAILLFLMSTVIILLSYFQPLRSFQRFSTTYDEITTGDLNRRTPNWRQGFASFAEHPLAGVGSNMYRSVNNRGKVAHNSFISVLVEVGLIGIILFGTIVTIAVVKAMGQPKLDSRFWLCVLLVWGIGASTLTWEYRKSTWLFLSLVVVSAALPRQRDEAMLPTQPHNSQGSTALQP